MFIAREKELEALRSFYEKDGLSLMVISGRRRVGKSTLIGEFAKDKKTIFYTATKVGKERNLELFSKEVVDFFLPGVKGVNFQTAEAVFDFIAKNVKEKLLLVIDELPYWADKDEALLSILQKYIDTVWHDKNIKIILCGSSLSYMEDKVLSEKSPLFGRRDSQMKVEPFSYLDTAKFVPGYSLEEKAIIYGVTGGVAKYLSLIDPDKSLEENIVAQFFNPNGYLYDETHNLLSQEFSDIALINSIIETIAEGQNQLNVISEKVKEKEPTVLYALKKLIDVGLVEKRLCITEENNRKKRQYVLKDNMFRFWYRYIPEATSVIELGQGERYFQMVVKKDLHSYMGSIFEEMCREYVLRQGAEGKYGPFISKAGTWWGSQAIVEEGMKKVITCDIDIVATSPIGKKMILGECKFRNEKMDKSAYDELTRRAKIFENRYSIEKFLFFSLSGYADFYASLNKEDVLALTLIDLYRE